MKEFTVTKNDAGRRADRFLSKALPGISTGALQKAFRKKDVKHKGLNTAGTWKPCRADDRLCEGDIVRIYGTDNGKNRAMWASPPTSDVPPVGDDAHTVPALSPDWIVYQDPRLLVLHKPAGLPSQRNGTEYGIEDMARVYLLQKGEWSPEQENGFLPSLCHRLDRNTEGLLLFAKTAEALRVLTEKIKIREINKYYHCVVEGTPSPPEGEWRDRLWKDAKQSRSYVRDIPGAKEAVLRYRVLSSRGGRSLLEIDLLTGRTHQIRVQCASRGHPIAGDGKYGRGNDPLYRYQALCAVRIAIRFKTGAGALQYLDGKVFEINKKFPDFY